MQDLWNAFMHLFSAQIKNLNQERWLLEHESIKKLERFHNYYDQELERQRDKVMQMFRETQNYKKTYDRLQGDYQGLKVKAEILGKKLNEVTIFYKQKCTREDYLVKQVNNLTSMIQNLNEESEDEDPEMKGGYFDGA